MPSTGGDRPMRFMIAILGVINVLCRTRTDCLVPEVSKYVVVVGILIVDARDRRLIFCLYSIIDTNFG
jgi:hypothetical protein